MKKRQHEHASGMQAIGAGYQIMIMAHLPSHPTDKRQRQPGMQHANGTFTAARIGQHGVATYMDAS